MQQFKEARLDPIKDKLKALSGAVLQEPILNKWNIKKVVPPTPQQLLTVDLPPPSIDFLLAQKDFDVKLDSQVFHISRDIKEDEHAYLIYNKELRGGETFKVTITAISTTWRHLELGI